MEEKYETNFLPNKGILKGIWANNFVMGVLKDTYATCLVFFKKAHIVGIHLYYLYKFIKHIFSILVWIATTCRGNLDEYPQHIIL